MVNPPVVYNTVQPKFVPKSGTENMINLAEMFPEFYMTSAVPHEAVTVMQTSEGGGVQQQPQAYFEGGVDSNFLNFLCESDMIQQSYQQNRNYAERSSAQMPIRVPPMPRSSIQANLARSSGGSYKRGLSNDEDGDSDDCDDDNDLSGGQSSKKQKNGKESNRMNSKQKNERRERNREHAKRSRIRKKVLLDSLQGQLAALRTENTKLRRVVAERIPSHAASILESCTTEESHLLSSDFEDEQSAVNQLIPRQSGLSGGPKRILMEPDFRLISSLITSQQNFVVSDPSLPDNPIVYCSEGFCKLTGYRRQDVLGRNCRFLQGPETDQRAVDMIRQGVAQGRDVSVCLLNYKADGTPFWNQFFVAALRGGDGSVVNFVGVQCEVNTVPVEQLKDRVKKLPLPYL